MNKNDYRPIETKEEAKPFLNMFFLVVKLGDRNEGQSGIILRYTWDVNDKLKFWCLNLKQGTPWLISAVELFDIAQAIEIDWFKIIGVKK